MTKNEKQAYISELDLRDRMIAEESKAKYEAYERIAELEKQIQELEDKLKND